MMCDLAVYDTNEPPTDFSIATELDALDRAADAAGFKRSTSTATQEAEPSPSHMRRHAGIGSRASVDERASDFTPEGNRWTAGGVRQSSALPPQNGLGGSGPVAVPHPDAARDRGRAVGRDNVAHPVMAAALASRSSRLHGGRISAVTCGVPLLVRVHRRRQRHEHSVLTDPVDEAGWLQDHP